MAYPLARFLTASALLHGAVLFAAAMAGGVFEPRGQTLAMQLLPAVIEIPEQNHTLHADTASAAAFSSRIHRSSDWAVRTGPGQTTGSTDRPLEPGTAFSSDPAPATARDSATRPAQPRTETTGQRLSRQVLEAMLPYFHYPLFARQQGWQGEVQVAVHIAQDGRLSNLRLARTSGYPILDAAALDSLEKIHRLPDATTTLLDASGFDLNVPVVYRLTEG
ncbi:MAG TPA: energy transducer TonB [Acidiferrobacterales bacterium]|nr:energy transducer TonB [Acidiferrobacterales bacterium]